MRITTPLGINERRVLRYLRNHPGTPRYLLTEHIGVTPQAIGQIVRRLAAKRLLIEHDALRIGRHCQPPRPLSINPKAAHSLGIKIGRRHTDIVVLDLQAQVIARHSIQYVKPVVEELLPRVRQQIERFEDELQGHKAYLTGVGVAMPFALGGWQSLLGLTEVQSKAWDTLDLLAFMRTCTSLPIYAVKDTAAACVAEMLDGHGRSNKNFLYFFVDTFVGGALASEGGLARTDHGNAGAIASVPVSALPGHHDSTPVRQLVHLSSLYELEERLDRAGLDPQAAYDERALEAPYWGHTTQWLDSASHALASAVVSGVAFTDVGLVVIDGALPPAMLCTLIAKVHEAMKRFNWEGIWAPQVLQGTVGADAGAIGGALLPLYEHFYA